MSFLGWLRQLLRGDANSRATSRELETLLRELSESEIDREPARASTLCQRILALSDMGYTLPEQTYVEVMSTCGNAWLALSRTEPGPSGLANLDAAIACFEHALLENFRDATPLRWAGTQKCKGKALRDRADRLAAETRLPTLQQAIACFDEALRVFRKETTPGEWAATLTDKASVLRDLADTQDGEHAIGMLQQAIACCDQALLVRRQDAAPREWAATMQCKAVALDDLSTTQSGAQRVATLQQAIACCDQALLVRRQDMIPLEWAATMRNKGDILCNLAGRGSPLGAQSGAQRAATLQQAIDCYDQSLLVRRREVTPALWAATLNNKGIAVGDLALLQSGAQRAATLQQAIDCYDQSLLEYRRDIAPIDWAMANNNKGATLRDLALLQSGAQRAATLQQAIDCYDQSLLEYRRDIVPIDWARTVAAKGRTAYEIAKTQVGLVREYSLRTSISCLSLALDAYPVELQPGDHRSVAHSLCAAQFAQAMALGESIRGPELAKASRSADSGLRAAHRVELRAPSLTFLQREWSENAQLYSLAACIQASIGDLRYAVQLLEQGRTRLLIRAADRRNADISLLNDTEQTEYLSAVQLVLEIEARDREEGEPLKLLYEAGVANANLESVVARLREKHPEFMQELTPSVATLTECLKPGEAYVYVVPQDLGTIVLLVRGEGEPRFTWVESATQQTFAQLSADMSWWKDPSALERILAELGDMVGCHIASLLHACGCSHAILVPAGHLSILPLHACTYVRDTSPSNTSMDIRTYLCDDFRITYAPSGLVHYESRKKAQERIPGEPHVFAAGNPKLTRTGESWTVADRGYLRFGEWEARRVGELAMERYRPANVDIVTNEQATWEAVMNGLRRADMVHLAVHALFDAVVPTRSAFLVAPQARLFLRELLDPRLLTPARLRLVVLSACESAARDVQEQSEEAIGLFGGLLAAGAPAVIGTLWPVGDLAAAALMESFAYRYLVKGQASDDALWGALRELRGLPDQLNILNTDQPQGPLHSSEGVSTDQTLLSELVPVSTKARQRWSELVNHVPEAALDTRQLSTSQLTAVGQQVAAFRAVLPEHPVHWAAFVYYGTSVSLEPGMNIS